MEIDQPNGCSTQKENPEDFDPTAEPVLHFQGPFLTAIFKSDEEGNYDGYVGGIANFGDAFDHVFGSSPLSGLPPTSLNEKVQAVMEEVMEELEAINWLPAGGQSLGEFVQESVANMSVEFLPSDPAQERANDLGAEAINHNLEQE